MINPAEEQTRTAAETSPVTRTNSFSIHENAVGKTGAIPAPDRKLANQTPAVMLCMENIVSKVREIAISEHAISNSLTELRNRTANIQLNLPIAKTVMMLVRH